MKKVLVLLTVLAAALALVACSGASAGLRPGQDYVVDEPAPAGAENARQVELVFSADDIKPNSVTFKGGEKVLFVIKNTDMEKKEDHNFLSREVSLSEILVHSGQTVRRLWTVPTKPGTYEPSCTIHPWIRMTFVVQ